MRSKANIIVNRIGLAMLLLGIGGCYMGRNHPRGYPWLFGAGIALCVTGSILGNMKINAAGPSLWSRLTPTKRDDWFSQSVQSLAKEHRIVTRLMLVNQLVREMNLPLDEAQCLVDDYCQRKAPATPQATALN